MSLSDSLDQSIDSSNEHSRELDNSASIQPRIMAVVVCYNPEIQALSNCLLATSEQVEKTVVVDNLSQNRHQVLEAISQLAITKDVVMLPQTSNLGLGAAHNVGINYARNAGFSHVLILDQDSVPLAGMVNALFAAWMVKNSQLVIDGAKQSEAVQQTTQQPIAAVGATYFNADNGSESFFVRFGWLKFARQFCRDRDFDGCIRADFLISSGCLLAIKTVDDIGLMNESLFIDHIDTEWFLRARSRGYIAYGVCDALMQHGLGEVTHQVSLGGKKMGRQRNVPQHKPFRYYYIFRNSVILYKKAWVSNRWKWNDLQRLMQILIMFGIWKSPRKANLIMILRGIWDGLRGVSGERVFTESR